MDVNDIVNALEGICDLGDTLDSKGIGISAMTNGEHTTRGLCKMELGAFLLYVGAGGAFFNDGQAGLVNLLLSDQYGQIPAWRMKSVAEEMNTPIAANNATYAAFKNGDDAITQQNGTRSTQLTDALINLYETFGTLMVAFNENAVSRSRCDSYVRGLKARQRSSDSSVPSSTAKPAAKPTGREKVDVSQYIPAGVTLTDVQKEYLEGVVGCMEMRNRKSVSKSDVELYMGKSSSAVSSGIRTLVKKGILEINDDAEIVIAGKNGAAPKKKAAVVKTGKTVRYDSRISFELPDNYKVTDEKDNKGERQYKIEVNPHMEDGSEQSDATFNISIVNGNDCDKDILDEACDANQNAAVKRRYDSDPEAALVVNQMNMNILGSSLTIGIYRLFIRLSKNQALQIFTTKTGADEDTEGDLIEQLTDVWKTIRINGKQVRAGDLDSNEINAESKKHLEEEVKYDEEELDKTVRIEGQTVRIGDRWEMTLPFNWRADIESNDTDHTLMTIYTGTEPSGQTGFGSTVGKQKQCNTAINAALIRKTLNAAKIIEEAVVRRDNRMDVIVTVYVNSDGTTIADIKVVEKVLYNNETLIQIVLTSQMDDIKDALEKIKEKDYMLGIPFGLEYENKWMGTLRLAASIRPVNEKNEEIELQARTTLFKGITGCVPKSMKLLKGGEDEDDAYYPAKGKPSDDEFRKNEWDCFMKISKIDGSDLDSIHDQMAVNVQAGMYARFLVRFNNGPSPERISESYTETGYKSLWLNIPAGTVILSITTGDFDQALIQIISDTGKSPVELLRIGRAVYDTIEINGESESVAASPFPPGTQLLHEHYDLVESEQYTTRRDADFIGQSIRGLMEKNGTTDENAYDEMKLPGDEYDLDREALALAKVFRLNEELFDPYVDTEALIRKAMFKNAGAFHALRSLAWSVSAQADRQCRDLESYSYDELEKIGDLIQEQNNLVYQAYSYRMGLCNHYDWHVFYVPDAYLGGKESDNTDLRYPTGKENRGGNSITIFGGIGGFGDMRRINDLIGRNEETLVSLEALRKDLEELLPVMRTIYNGLMADRDRSQRLEGPLPEALTAWCALAIAAKEPFYSEEAADTPEADAGLEGPLERPTDRLDDKPARKAKPAAKKTTKNGKNEAKATSIKAEKPSSPAGDDLGLNGATVIKPGQFIANMSLKNIVIPEGVTEIGERAFSDCMFLETVVFPKSLKKIGEFAFMSCRALRKVELQEGVEELGTHVFGATSNLREVHLPDSLKKVDRCVFGLGGDSPYATAYLSGKLAKQLYDASSDDFKDIYARHLVIDGKPYESVKEFLYKEFAICAKGYYPPYDPEAAARVDEAEAKQYRSDMERACKEGKTLQDMIDAARKKISTDPYSDKEAFELAVKNLDRNAAVIFSGKHFVLTGFGIAEDEVKAEIEKRGGIVHSSMVKMADYLVVRLESPGAGKTKKALEWRQKGANNRIVSDFQMWQAVFGKTSVASSGAKNALTAGTTAAEAEAEKIRQEATKIIENVQTDISSTKSALEKHAENLRRQEKEKEKRIKEAKAKGKSEKDETDMLAVLLIEEDQGNLDRSEDEFVEIYAEDFGAYNEAQLKKLRKKVLPKIHDERFVEGAKEEMLSRPVKNRFSISTGNWFNLSNHWNFREKGEMAIEKTRIWYRDNELDEVRTLMENHKKEACDSVNRQLSSFNDAWVDFNGVKNDLHIDISETDEDVSPKHSLFDVKLNSRLRVQIILKHPSMGFLTIPVMSLFPSVWNVKPEQIWDAAMNNTMDDSRGVSSKTRTDAAAAEVKALEQIRPAGKAQASKPASAPAKKPVSVKQRPVTYGLDEESDYSATWKHEKKNTPASGSAAAPAASAQGADDQKERQRNHIWGLIRDLEDERDAIKGLFAGMRRNKLQKRIDELKDKLRQL